MSVEDVQAVIDSAKARGMEHLESFIRRRAPGVTDAKLEEASELAVEIIESIPVFLARASQEARNRNMVKAVQPVLDQAERYFLQPIDLIPEMTQGLAGLLDDAYLVLRILQNLDRGPRPFLDWDLEFPVAFLRSLIGDDIGRRLDDLAASAMSNFSQQLAMVWELMAHEA